MSKFEELQNAYTKSREEIQEYENDCKTFAEKIIGGLVNYLEAPKENFQYLPLNIDEEIKKNYHYAMEIELEEDTYFHVRFRIHFNELAAVAFTFLIKKDDNHFIIRGYEKDIEHKIDPDNETDYTNFYEYIFQQLKEYYKTGFQNWLKGEPSQIDKIGFF